MILPKKVFIKTYGCQMNVRDSEQIVAELSNAGYSIVDSEKEADIFILNTCSVREQAEIKAIGKSGFLARRKKQRQGRLLGVVGCMAENLREQLFVLNPEIDFIIGPRRLHELKNILEQQQIKQLTLLGSSNENRDFQSLHDFKKKSANAYVSIMQGCNMCCSYCIVPKTRGSEVYRPIDDIVNECMNLANHGVKEVMLLGQIVNNYGQGDMKIINGVSPFVQLLERINGISGIYRIRYMSPHPKGFREDLINAHAKLEKLCPSVHLPVQSGSNKILRLMKRPYSRERIIDIVSSLRQKVHNITLTTDIIVGYPGETEQDFEETVSLLEEIKFNMAFIFKYSPRIGTESSKLQDSVSADEKDRRNKILLNIVQEHSLEYNRSMIGSNVEVLVVNHAKRGEQKLYGYTSNGYKVIFDGSDENIGNLVPVAIDNCGTTSLYGRLI